jgi:glycerol-3-phosphate acyltransferase PlsY
MSTIGGIFLVGMAYGLGAVPWGVVLGRIFAGTDLREHGSQSTGATNAYRVLGGRYSAAVFVLDFLKGMIPVLVGRWLDLSWWFIALAAFAAVAGHCWSIFIGFSGGKGMATGAGAIIAMTPWALLALPVMIVIVWLTRYVSLASLTGTAIATVLVGALAVTDREPAAAAFACIAIAAVIFQRHKGNIERLLNGSERRLTRRRSPAT